MKAPTARGKGKNITLGLFVLAAGLLAGGSFMVASGQVAISSPSSLLAAVFTAVSGKPVVVITKDASSPSGTITTGGNRAVAIFDVYAKNVTYAATLKTVSVEVALGGSAAKKLNLTDLYATYQYCVPSGVTYGYGYKGGNCTNVRNLQPYSMTRTGNVYTLQFSLYTPLYMQQAPGMLTIYARPGYSLGGTAADTATVRAHVSGGVATGDQCASYSKTADATRKGYGYSKCVSQKASVTSSFANTLQVQRSYGYGYCLI